MRQRPTLLAILLVCSGGQPSAASPGPESAPRAGGPRRGEAATRPLEDFALAPTEFPSLGSTPVEQVIVAGDALAAPFRVLAADETRRGIPTVVRTLSWIEEHYDGFDSAARIRTFLRAAHQYWGTRAVVLGGDTEHVPSRYVSWSDGFLLTDLYFECLDREWNEDGDARIGEPSSYQGFDDVVTDVAEAPDGAIWASTYAGLVRIAGASITVHDFAHGFPSDAVYCVSIAPDGAVWVGTDSGAAVLAAGAWRVSTIDQGLPTNRIHAILARAANDVWAGTDEGLAHWDGAGWSSWGVADGLPAPLVTALAHDGTSLWVATLAGAARFDGSTFTVFDASSSGLRSDWVLGLGVDAQGAVWFGHIEDHLGRGGVSRYANGTWTSDDLAEEGGLSPREFVFGPGAGEWWAATSDGIFHRSSAGDELIAEAGGLPAAAVSALVRGADGSFAVAQGKGLSVGAPGAWSTYTVENGLPRAQKTSDDVDLLPEVVVGRIPATDAAEVAAYVQKLRAYRSGANAAGAENALFLGQVLFESQDGKDICEETASVFPASFAKTKLYQSEGTLNTASAIAGYEAGPGIVVHVSHGSYDVLGAGPGLLFNGDLDRLDANGRSGLYVVYSCNVGGFDENSAMEHLLFNPNGGAIATLSNTREAVAWIDSEFNRAFFEELFASADGRPAEALRATRERFVAEDSARFRSASWWRRMYLARSYLGSPTLSIWRETPSALVVSHPATTPLVRTPFEVVVTDAGTGLPVEGALVCASKGSDDYVAGTTDAEGRVTFQLRPESPGALDVVVSAPDHLPYEGTATVASASGPSLVAAGWGSPGGPPPAERARSITIALGLRNVGLDAQAGWSLHLASSDPNVAVAGASGTLAAIAGGATGWTSPFTLLLDPGLPNGSMTTLTLTGTGPSSFAETFLFPIEAPRFVFEGFASVGDAIVPRVTNRGAIAAENLVGTLEAIDDDAVVLDGETTWPLLYAGVTSPIGDGFRVAGPLAARFRLTLTGTDAAPLVLEVDREAPLGVSSLASEPRDRGARLHWAPSRSDDVAAYRVHARTPNGAWSATPAALVADGANALVSVPAGGSREFLVLAVDASGNASADTAFVLAHASPETMAGWPRALSSIPGPTSLVAQDLDGDGSKEILLGSMWDANAVHVLRADGSEWVDGDLEPSTFAIFGKTGGRVNGAPLAVDVDGDGHVEVFAGSYDGFVHAWRTNGAPGAPPALGGWPAAAGENGSRVAPVAGDLDGDGMPEIVVVGNDGLVRAIETNGAPMPGWPVATRRKSLGSVPAIADLNGDGRDDVVFGATDSSLYVVGGDGSPLPGWPLSVGDKIISSPVLADVDGDGDLEIFAFDRSGRFWGLQHDDRDAIPGPDPLAGWPVQLGILELAPPSPALGDFDGDGIPELVVNDAEAVVILRADGTHYGASPIVTGSSGVNSPLIADLDGDGSLDVLVALEDRRLVAMRPDGTVLPGWPMRSLEPMRATPVIADVDGDGRLDLAVAADDATIVVLRLPTPDVEGVAPWPGYHGGTDLRGVYRSTPLPPVAVHDAALLPVQLRLAPARPNPFRGTTEIRFDLPAPSRASLDVFDVTGRRITELLAEGLLEAGAHRRTWDGRDASGRPVSSGVYFVRLRAGDRVESTRVLRVR